MKFRVVFDTNILISATFWQGIPRYLLELAEKGEIELITSSDMIKELSDVLIKERKFGLTAREVLHIIEDIIDLSYIIEPAIGVKFSRDSDDNKVLECAVSSNADYIISADYDLLDIESFIGVKIVTAEKLLNSLRSLS